MQSSREEFLLILNKWKQESANVVVAAAFSSETETSAAVTVLKGKVKVEEESLVFMVVSEDGSLFSLRFADVGIGYSANSKENIAALTTFVEHPEEIEDIVALRYGAATICLCSLKS